MNMLNTSLIQNNNSQPSTLCSPHQLKARYALPLLLTKRVAQQRQTIQHILSGQDSRLLVITGPCSIHDPIAALEYAQKLVKLQEQVKDHIYFVMRAYIEKPRTTVGWKGYLYDPHLNGASDLQTGLENSRALYLQIIELGLPIASEILNPLATGYFDDLIAWGAIGARTSESQIHREISSHMPYSVGFKNGTDGSIQIALDAIESAKHQHQFLGINLQGQPALLQSQGNPLPHLILRGSNSGANYSEAAIRQIKAQCKTELPAMIVDCSHGNSAKNPLNQPQVLKQIIAEREQTNVKGVMLESHLVEGQQKISNQMNYGQSVTDGCLGWENTEQLLLEVCSQLKERKLQAIA